jgi:Na+/H+-dicarboxylate symporter
MATMKVVEWIIYLAPIGVFFLIIGQILEMQNLGESFQLLGWYLLTVVVGILLHGLLVLPLIFGKILCILLNQKN